MSELTRDVLLGYRRENADPPYLHPDYMATRTRAPAEPLVLAPAHALRGRPARCSAHERVERARPRPDPAARRRAARRADHRPRARARRRRPAGAATRSIEIWQANAAGRYRHAVRPASGAARPELHRRRALHDRRRGPLPLRRRSSPAPTRGATTTTRGAPRTSTSRCSGRAFAQRLVTQMYFPGDPLFAQDPIFNSVRDPKAPRAADRRASTSTRPCPSGRSATASTSCCAAATRPRRRRTTMALPRDAVADRRPVLLDRAAARGRRHAASTRTTPDAVRIARPRPRRRRASRCPTRWSRSGRPTRTAATPPGRHARQRR